MKVELVPHVGKTYSGREVKHDQWFVFADGVKIGILPFNPEVPLMYFANQPADVHSEVIEKLERITKRKVLSPVAPIIEPPEIDNSLGEDDDDEDGND